MHLTQAFAATAVLGAVLSHAAPTAQLYKRNSTSTSPSNSTSDSRVTNDKLFFRNPTVESVPGTLDTATNGNPAIQGNNPSQFSNDSETAYTAKYTPAGGNVIQNPEYFVGSEFDYQSLIVGINQELIEYDLFHHALAQFSVEEFEAAGIDADQRYLLEYMGNQEIGHALLLTNMVGPDRAPKMCTYQYPFNTVKEFILFSQLLTRFGEAGVYGFLSHLDARPVAQNLIQSITVEARQQMAFRQMQGLFAMPEWFEVGIPQAYAWTLLQRYIKSCPENNPHINFQIFPDLLVTNQPYLLDGVPAINSNYSLNATGPGREVNFTWDDPGKVTGYDGLYKTDTVAGEPVAIAWISQLNVTYTPIYNRQGNSACTQQPEGLVYPPFDPTVVGSVFISLVSDTPFLTTYNLTLINNITRAGPALYQAS